MTMQVVHLLDEDLGEVMMQDGRVVAVPKEVLKRRAPTTLTIEVVKLWAVRSGLILPTDEIASLGPVSAAA